MTLAAGPLPYDHAVPTEQRPRTCLEMPMDASLSLYRRVLGPRFDALPAVLQRFHGSTTGGQARGTFRVTRGAGWLRNTLANVLGLPQAGGAVPVRLQVVVEGDKERWYRHFPGHSMSTSQWANGDCLIESNGLGSFQFALVIDGSRLTHEFRQARCAGIPLPRTLAPYVNGWVDAGDTGWNVFVHIFFPWVGEIASYEGWVEPE